MDGDRQRAAIVAALRDAPDGLGTAALGRNLRLHPNTVRWHLARLSDDGLVRSAPEHRHARGRPSAVHRLTAEGVASGRDEYRLLATMLTTALGTTPHGPRHAYATGVEWGHQLSAREPAADVATLLDRQGFAAEQNDDLLEMRRCPFYALAETHPDIVCTLHHGIIDGALENLGSTKHVEQLEPFVEPALCVARLGESRG